MTAPNPGGCQHCGIDDRDHMQRWTTEAGWHTWTQPTNDQIKDRMNARRNKETQ